MHTKADKIHRVLFLSLLAVLGIAMVSSVWVSNLAWVLLVVNWIVEGRWKEKLSMARSSAVLPVYLSFFIVLLVSMLWTEDTSWGFYLLQVKLPLLLIPLVLCTSKSLSDKEILPVVLPYMLAVLVMSGIGVYRKLSLPDVAYRDLVPHISHIRFALNCCVMVYLAVSAFSPKSRLGNVLRGYLPQWLIVLLSAAVVCWMLFFILLLHSYTAIAVLLIVSAVIVFFHYRRPWAMVVWIVVISPMVGLTVHEVRSYYSLSELARSPLEAYTVNGNPYTHASDGLIENGNYINDYVCDAELASEWEKRSFLSYKDNTASGYSVRSTLIRYLNAVGQTKDSVGIASLTASQIADIEKGVANPVYLGLNPIKKMVYTLLLEREYYVHSHAVAGFSFIQRLELWKASLSVFRSHPLFGVGVGDVVDAMDDILLDNDSEIGGLGMRSHNQYLGLLAAAGIVGSLVVLFFAVRACLLGRRSELSGFLVAWMLTVLISCLTEDTLDTQAGILLSTFFLSLRPQKDRTR